MSDIIMIKNKTKAGKIFSFALLPAFAHTTMGVLAITGTPSTSIDILGITGFALTTISILSRNKHKTERYKFKIVYD